MPRYAAKIDANQPEIVEGLRAIGASVESLAKMGRGWPDIAVGYNGINFLLEIANPETRHGQSKVSSTDHYSKKTNEAQRAWYQSWRGRVDVVFTLAEAVHIVTGRGKPIKVAHF